MDSKAHGLTPMKKGENEREREKKTKCEKRREE